MPDWNADGSLANLPRNTSFTTPWSTWANKQHTVFTSPYQRLPGNWNMHLGYARTESTNRTTDPATGEGMRLWTGAWGPGKRTGDNFDPYASGPFTLLGRKHTAIVGWNGGNQRARSLGGEAEIAYPHVIPDYRCWTDNIPRPLFHADGSHTETVTRLAGACVATRLRLAASYRFDGQLQGLRAGASMTAQSATYSEAWYGRPPSGDVANIPQAGYALVNAMASYALNKHASVQLNVDNLLDKKYYRNVGFSDGVYWGEARNIGLSLRGTY